MRVHVSTSLSCSAERAWELIQRSSTLIMIAWPLVKISPSQLTFPLQWKQGETVYCKIYLFGVIPFSERRIFFERIDSQKREIQSREADALIKKWDHLISIKAKDNSTCMYSDEIEINAGLLTIFIWAFAQWFYRYRQARWKTLLVKGL